MQQPQGPSPIEPSRRRPPRPPASDAVPIPEAAGRSPRARNSGVQDVLAAHQRAVDARIEEGLREIRLAVSEAVGRPLEPPPLLEETPQGPPPNDVLRGLVAHTEERFQALSLRLRRIEDVLRQVAKREGPDIEMHIDGVRRSIASIAATQQQEVARVIESQRQATAQLREDIRTLANGLRKDYRAGVEALAKHQRAAAEAVAKEQRAAVEQMGARIGRGIAAIASRLREDLSARQDALVERSLRGLATELRRHQSAPSPAAAPSGPGPTPRPAAAPPRPPAAPAPRQASQPEPARTPPPMPTPAKEVRSEEPPSTRVPPAAPVPQPPRTASAEPAAAPDASAGSSTPSAAPGGSASQPEDAPAPSPRPEPRHYLIERKRPTSEVDPGVPGSDETTPG